MYDTTLNLSGDVKDNEKTIHMATRRISKISLPEIKQFGNLQNVIVNAVLKFHKRKQLKIGITGILWSRTFVCP